MVADAVVSRRSMTLWTLAVLLHLQAVPALLAATMPTPVSPGAAQAGALTESRCPTFSWGGVAGAPGYELAVFRVTEEGAEPELVARVSLPADSRAWTPSVGQCLVRGGRYAWSIAARTAEGSDREREWAPALLFEIEAAGDGVVRRPAVGAERSTTAGAIAEIAGLDASVSVRERVERASLETPVRSGPRDPAVAGPSEATADALVGRAQIVRAVSQASTPSIGAASLSVSQQIHMGAASDIFRDGDVFLWDDTNGNIALGRSALSAVSGSANNNTALGKSALQNTTGGAPFHGSDNTAVGTAAMQSNTTGRANTAIGAAALLTNTTGYLNAALGVHSLISNTTGRSNTGAGAFTLRSNTTGSLNTASGVYALDSNSTASFNTATGFAALRANTTGTENTAAGSNALRYNTTGSQNVAIGTNALFRNTTGAFNSASGVRSLEANTTGHRNTAAGSYALFKNTTGARNTAIGHVALFQNTTANYNTAVGAHALEYTTTGDRNVAVGDVAGRGITTGHRNVLIGRGAGETMSTGYRNVVIGYGAASDHNRTIVIGQLAFSYGDQQIMIGHPGIHTGGTFIQGIFGAPTPGASAVPVFVNQSGRLGTLASTLRVKRDIADVGALADRLLELRPVAFRYKEEVAQDADSSRQFGLIAEEVAEIFPELVVFDAAGKPLTVKYHLLSSLLLAALQRQHAQLEDQARLVRQREEESASMRARLAAIEARVGRFTRAGGRQERDTR